MNRPTVEPRSRNGAFAAQSVERKSIHAEKLIRLAEIRQLFVAAQPKVLKLAACLDKD
jgi:hypothetical protein